MTAYEGNQDQAQKGKRETVLGSQMMLPFSLACLHPLGIEAGHGDEDTCVAAQKVQRSQ